MLYVHAVNMLSVSVILQTETCRSVYWNLFNDNKTLTRVTTNRTMFLIRNTETDDKEQRTDVQINM